MGVKVANNAHASLVSSISNTATTITVGAGQGNRFPSLGPSDYFYATLIDTSNNLEIVKVTARSGDTMTVVRGQDGTTARAYAVNDRLELRPTAALFNDLVSGPITASGLTMNTARLLGRTSSGSGSVEEISVSGATLNGGVLTIASAVQIQPISASVGSNALTISASALSLEFRSATLGSGTVTRVSGTPGPLVISAGSTLGTVDGVQSHIAVLALNNAGTIELAAVNIAGGVNLDETDVISTTAEGGAGGADSATVIYSTTARTNVAYRVIGIIRSTQATAGLWATAPSLVQGAGGNAITAMQSIGYGQTWQNLTGSRFLDTNYYNTTGKPIFVSVTTNSNATPLTLVVNDVWVNRVVVGSYGIPEVSGIVPVGGKYLVSHSGGVISVWSELR